jgi:large subunit ribosomal protein L30
VASLHITQIKSVIGSRRRQRDTLRGLGIRRMHQTVTQPDRPEIRGMIAKVSHLLRVVEGDDVVSAPAKEPKSAKRPSGRAAAAEQHAAGLDATDEPDRPAAPDSPAAESTAAPEEQPDTGPSGETSTSAGTSQADRESAETSEENE